MPTRQAPIARPTRTVLWRAMRSKTSRRSAGPTSTFPQASSTRRPMGLRPQRQARPRSRTWRWWAWAVSPTSAPMRPHLRKRRTASRQRIASIWASSITITKTDRWALAPTACRSRAASPKRWSTALSARSGTKRRKPASRCIAARPSCSSRRRRSRRKTRLSRHTTRPRSRSSITYPASGSSIKTRWSI